MKMESEREALDRVCSLSMVFIHRNVLGLPNLQVIWQISVLPLDDRLLISDPRGYCRYNL